ncbi:MAG TPA: RsmE family RNA methyltransferase [Candidatus Paceibacterota bacterium]|nr:RsmE family RNA methyltransferase [Candidatus Paceibacterota bacterium]
MRLHRFFIDQEIRDAKDVVVTDRDLLNQWKNVFRLGKEDRVILLDGSGFEFEAEFALLARDRAELAILAVKKAANVSERNITLYASLIKKDNFEWVLEKGTELGVAGFVPLQTERSEKKDLNIERAKRIIREASEQSGRGMEPELYAVDTLADAVGNASMKLVAFDPTGAELDRNSLRESEIGILVGPEGGWSERELAFFKEKNISVYTLGPQVLRAETAAIAISTLALL